MRKSCERYEEWKAERALKTKIEEKKKEKTRRKKLKKIEEVEEDEVDEFGKIRKCKKRKEVKREKKKKPRQRVRRIYKHIPESELILGCIKPSVEVREYFLNPRHIPCMGLTIPPMYISEPPPRKILILITLKKIIKNIFFSLLSDPFRLTNHSVKMIFFNGKYAY